jgi:hypothetical protein
MLYYLLLLSLSFNFSGLPSAPYLAQGMNFTFHAGAGQNGLFPRMSQEPAEVKYSHLIH